jgi:hypothetical protein
MTKSPVRRATRPRRVFHEAAASLKSLEPSKNTKSTPMPLLLGNQATKAQARKQAINNTLESSLKASNHQSKNPSIRFLTLESLPYFLASTVGAVCGKR